MKTLEKSRDRVQQICEEIRHQTIEPAKNEARVIEEEAKKKSEEIISAAEKEAERIIEETRKNMEQERKLFHSSLEQAANMSIESLRQEFEKRFFNKQLEELLAKETTNPEAIASLVKAIVNAIKKEGIEADLSVIIPQVVSPKEVNKLLGEEILKELRQGSVKIGNINGGVEVQLVGKHMKLVLTDEVLKELLTQYIRKDFRKHFFGS